MPYPVKAPKPETFPDSPSYRSKQGGIAAGAARGMAPSVVQTMKTNNSKSIQAHPKYTTYWQVMKEDGSLKDKAYEFDERLNYFLPPLRDEGKNTKFIYPTVISKDAILTAKGVVPRYP